MALLVGVSWLMPFLGGISPLTCIIFKPTKFDGILRNHVFHIFPIILKVIEYTSKVTSILSFGIGAFDTLAMIVGLFNPDSPLVKLNQELHSNTWYNLFQAGVSALAVFSTSTYLSMKGRLKLPPVCFAAGTMILTVSGLVAIENIRAGDRVIATSPETFETAVKTVVETYVRETPQLIHLGINGEEITTSWNHPFYVKEKGFVNAEDLQAGDMLVNSTGETYPIENIEVEIVKTPETVYNFQVEDFHTYHVGSAGVLVHNSGCPNEGGSASKIGDFSNLEGSTVDDVLDRIPDEATLRELHPVEGGATEGFEFKWVQEGQTYRVRVHNADPGAPSGSNAANSWIVRVQRGRQYYDYTINEFQSAKYTNPNGDFFDESIMNNTHIPILDPYGQ